MKEQIIRALRFLKIDKKEIESILETPKNPDMGDYALPCFHLAKQLKKSPLKIAEEIAAQIRTAEGIEKVEAINGYVNFFIDRKKAAVNILGQIMKDKERYGSSNIGKGKKVIIEMSSPNIAKPFGIGHLRSTIIGNSIANLYSFLGYKAVRINYLGDWGTPFGKIIAGYNEFGDNTKLKKNPIKHLYDIYVKVSNDESFEEKGRAWFKKLEQGDKQAIKLWKMFRETSIKDFDRIYKELGIKFEVISGESLYNNKMERVFDELKKKGLLEESDGAEIVNLESHGLGVALIKKSDGATLYVTRDIAAAIDRHEKYKFSRMFYEVGAEQKLHFRQLFKILEMMGYDWAKECAHIDHGLYLDKDGKKFATRKGKTFFMEDVLEETKEMARKEILKRGRVTGKELEKRARAVSIAAIFYGDLKNHRTHDIVFDIERFIEFEGDTGPYLLYSYARALSILDKAKYRRKTKIDVREIDEQEKRIIIQLGKFGEQAKQALDNLSPNMIANYAFELCQRFNEFYHNHRVIDSEDKDFRLALVDSFSQVLKNTLHILGIETINKM